MKKRINSISAIALCIAGLFFISGTSLSAEFKFREFKADHEKFERYTDTAEKSINEQEWQNILDSGKQEMQAEWERNARSELERYVRQGGDTGEVRASLEESRAEWESEYGRAESLAKGVWFVKRENLVFDTLDFSLLKKSVKDAGSDSTLTSAEAWDSYISSTLSNLNQSWDIKFIPLFESIKTGGELLTGDVKAGFDMELARFESELKRKFEVERNTIVYTGRNAFITELYIDTDSLKYKSARESADASTGNIIKEVQESLKSEEDKILTRSYNSEGVSSLDLSSLGDNWEEELKQLVNTGMEKWNGALDRLYRQMLSWKEGALDAYETAESLWRKAAEKLEQARSEWESKLAREIYEALDNWQKEERDLYINIETARKDFTGYLNNLSSQWNDHSSGLIDMAVNGSKVYTEALGNIKWLEKMSAESSNMGAYGRRGVVKLGNKEFWGLTDANEKNIINNIIHTLPGINAFQSTFGTGRMRYETCREGNCTENRWNQYLGSHYYVGGYYTYEYSGAVEKQDEKGNWYLTESYTVKVYGKSKVYSTSSSNSFLSYREYGWHEVDQLLETFTITNDVKKESSEKEKSSYYYYKTELERWEKIRDSFAGIAAEAEAYMHEKNMRGEQNGPGYLHNAGGSDPYLMTDAEFALQIASRDKDFWQKRLDIAKAVLDYAEQTKREGAGITEANKITAENRMKESKALYEKTLGEVDAIVEKLKILQGQKPSGARDGSNEAEWLAYLGSIEYLTAEYSKVNNALQEADKEYTDIKRSLILIENGEDTEYLIKEIHHIEKNILQADRELYNTQIELFRKQLESEYTGRTAGFAGNYETAVKNYEISKLQFNTLKSILTGEESDTALIAWGNAIISAKDLLWGDNSGQYSSIISNLITDYTPERRELLSSAIRNIYFNFQFNMESAELIITKLRDSTFNPDEFIETESSTDHSVYKKHADTSVRALKIIEETMELAEDNGTKTYETVIERLKTESEKEKYIYGVDNSRYIEHYTALKYFEERYGGLNAETWGSSRERLESEIRLAERASELHNDFHTLDADEIALMVSENEMKASLGDMDAAAILREYYLSGSGIAGLEYIDDFDKGAEKACNLNESLKAYVSENYRFFQKGQNLLVSHGYMDDLMGYLNSVVSLASGPGESLLTAEDFKTLTPESLSIAAGAVKDFIRKLDTDKVPIPDFLLTAADLILEVKERLDTGLFIRRYMENDSSAEMAGSVEDVYARKLKESEELKVVTDFIDYCGDSLETGIGDDYTLAMNIISEYETLSEDNKKYIKDHEDEKIKAVDQFIADLYLYRYAINLNNLALQYADTEFSVTPEQFAADKGLDDTEKGKLIKIIRPVYERRIFDNGYKDGDIKDINKYITERVSSGKINSEDGDKLKAYALINEYLHYSSGGNLTSTDPAFSEYIKYKKFENYILSITRDTEDSDEQHAEKCASAYHGVNGGDIEELTDFAESFIEGDLSAFSYLDEDVKIYAASEYYYDEMFSKNRVPHNSIEDFLEEKFGADSVNVALTDAVREYSGRLNTVSFYYGTDIDKYSESMDSAVKNYFLMYINGISEAILPGFEHGIYENGTVHGGLMVELGKITGELDRYAAGFSDLETCINKYNETAVTGLKNANALKAFYAGGEQGENWRNDMLAITEGEVLVTPVPAASLSEWSDSYDSTSGLRNTVAYSAIPLTRDGKVFYLNGIIDDMNKISSMFKSLGEAMKPGYKPEADLGIGAFLNEADKYYIAGNSYSYENSEFSFESLLRGAVSGYEAISESRVSEVSALTGTMSGMDSNLENIKNTFASKKRSYNFIAGGESREELLLELEASRVKHEKAKREVEYFRRELSDARKIYEETNTSYVKKMNLVSETFSDYKGFEFEYEKAYSIWEYAKTPYLHDDKTDAGDIGSGQTPTGGSTYYGNIPVPDARDNYQRVLEKYNHSETMYNAKAIAVTNQDTTAKLNEDAEYARLKADFIRKSESYIRTAQVNTEINEDLEKYKQQYSISEKIYINSKNSFTPYTLKAAEISGQGEAAVKKLAQQRDKILAHILKIGGNVSSEYMIQVYMNGLSWYSCAKNDIDNAATAEVKNNRIAQLRAMGYQGENSSGEKYSSEIAELKGHLESIYDKSGSNYQYSVMFYSLSEEARKDIVKIYNLFMTGSESDNLRIIETNFHQSMYWKREYEYAQSKVHKYRKKRHYVSRKKWQAKRDSRAAKYTNFNNAYLGAINPITSSLIQAAEDKADFVIKSAVLDGISSVRTLEEVKAYLKKGKYNLTDEDLSHLYDSRTPGLADDTEGINLDLLRIQNEKLRTDIDGDSVYASVDGDVITVLDKDGKPQFDRNGKPIEVYMKDDPSIMLELKDGKYLVYDRTYDISAVAGILKGEAEKWRLEFYAKMMGHTAKGVADGTRDNTVVLNDLEDTYHKLQEFAEHFNLTDKPNGEKRQRGMDGYVTITKEYVNNGQEKSVQKMIMDAMMKQSLELQEQLWQQQIEKFSERKNRWNEVTGYILNRGMAEWRENYSEFKNLWTKWRFDAKKMLSEGENWWAAEAGTMTQEMTLWSAETSKAASKEAAQQIYNELDGRISRYEADLKKKMPGNAGFEINTDKILSQAMKNRPVDSIGILTQTMYNTDTTAGFTNLLNLGLSGSLFKYNEEQMEEYTNAMGVMKNLQVIDILNSIIEGFNRQLEEANKNVYEGVDTNIRRNETFGAAPFNRRESENIWDIRVCVESNLTGDKFKTRRFTDYGNYINSTVYFQPIKGLDGTTIDFTQAHTYSNIDGEDLEVYVGLESEWLSRKIEGVFGNGGTFSTHQQNEYNRLYGYFGEYYGDWMAGKALQGAGFYSKPMFPHGPNMMQTAVMVAGVAGGPWAAFAVSMLTTGVQVSDGSMSWKQGAFQVGMSAATACIGVGASELSGMVGGAASAATEAGSRTMTQIAVENVSRTAANTLVSGISYDGEGLSYDKERMTSSRTWLAAGVTAGVGTLAAGYNLSGFSSALVNGAGSSLSAGLTTGDWSESFQTGAINAAGNYLGGLMAGGITQGLGTDNAYTQALISNYTTFGMRKLFGGDEKFDMGAIGQVDTMNLVVQDMYKSYKQKNPTAQTKTNEKNPADAADKFKDPFADIDTALSGVFTSLGRGLGQTMKQIGDTIQDGAKWAYDGVSGAVGRTVTALGNFAESTGNLFAEGEFATDTEVKQIREQERIKQEQEQQEILKGNKPDGMSDAEYNQKFKELEQKFKDSEKINNKSVDESLKNLTDLAQQNGGGSEYVREELKKALSKIPGGDKLNIDKIIETSCVSLSVWVALKQAGANVGEYGEFYAEQVKKGNISAENASVNKIHDLANSYKIDGKKPEVGFIRDFNKYEKLLNSGEVSNGVVLFERSKEKYHAINVYSSNEGIKISDVSYRTHGNSASEYTNAKKGNFRWLFYVKKGRR